MHSIDEMLTDIGLDVSPATRLRQWVLPISPGAYRSIEKRLLARRAALAASQHASVASASRTSAAQAAE